MDARNIVCGSPALETTVGRQQHPRPHRISTTLEIYTDTDEQARRHALTRLHGLLDQPQH
jgi:hypothetical protein